MSGVLCSGSNQIHSGSFIVVSTRDIERILVLDEVRPIKSIAYMITGFVICYLAYIKTLNKGLSFLAFLMSIIAYMLGLCVILFVVIFTLKIGKIRKIGKDNDFSVNEKD